jgi:hypothetical protein
MTGKATEKWINRSRYVSGVIVTSLKDKTTMKRQRKNINDKEMLIAEAFSLPRTVSAIGLITKSEKSCRIFGETTCDFSQTISEISSR